MQPPTLVSSLRQLPDKDDSVSRSAIFTCVLDMLVRHVVDGG